MGQNIVKGVTDMIKKAAMQRIATAITNGLFGGHVLSSGGDIFDAMQKGPKGVPVSDPGMSAPGNGSPLAAAPSLAAGLLDYRQRKIEAPDFAPGGLLGTLGGLADKGKKSSEEQNIQTATINITTATEYITTATVNTTGGGGGAGSAGGSGPGSSPSLEQYGGSFLSFILPH